MSGIRIISKRLFTTQAQTPSSVQSTVWHEAKNRQGRLYYVNKTSGEKSWEAPGEKDTLIRLPTKLQSALQVPKNASEKTYDLLVNSTNAYYGVFLLCCAGLAYRLAFPPVPPAPSIGPVANQN